MSSGEMQDDEIVLTEADFERAGTNPYPEIARERGLRVLDEDLRKAFPDSASVNDALRLLVKAARQATGKVELKKAS